MPPTSRALASRAPATTATPAAAVFRQSRSLPLDCIRSVAILAVVIYHVATRYPWADLDPLAYQFRRYGLLGVDVFFPLSGYLITGFLLRRSNTASIKVFFQRRFFRIVPLYVTAVTIFLLISLLLGVQRDSIGNIWGTYLFLTGWMMFFEGRDAIPYTITWSLSVEEFAYILFGLSAWLLRRNFLNVLVLVAVGALALRLWLNLQEFEQVYNFPPARLDSIAIGGIVAVMVQRQVRGMTLWLALLSVATYLLALQVPALWSTLKYTFIAFATCALIVLFEARFQGARNKPLSWFASIGFYSYFTYLFHLFNIDFILLLSERFMPGQALPLWLVVIVVTALTQIQAIISFQFFEGPMMRYGRSLEQRGNDGAKTPKPASGRP